MIILCHARDTRNSAARLGVTENYSASVTDAFYLTPFTFPTTRNWNTIEKGVRILSNI